MSSITTIQIGPAELTSMSSTEDGSCLSEPTLANEISRDSLSAGRHAVWFPLETVQQVLQGISRRWDRERRRRKVGRAYDMALEVARVIRSRSRVLDVGCGNGYIAHHLSSLLDAAVVGIDLGDTTEAPIDYRSFNGVHFPVEDQSFDAILLCYVLHHAQNLNLVMGELRRVLRDGGRAIIYEDIPETGWDRLVCSIHNRKWRGRTGRCTFHPAHKWRSFFRSAGFEIMKERRLSRWRNLFHPVSRRFYVLQLNPELLRVDSSSPR